MSRKHLLTHFEKDKLFDYADVKKGRPAKEVYYLMLAYNAAKRGTCLRRNYGAVIVKNDQVISTGYTGSPRGVPNCCDTKSCIREQLGIPRGLRYDVCRSVHAEQNAIIHADRTDMIGAEMYVVGIDKKTGGLLSGFPCYMCRRYILNSGIDRVYVVGDECVEYADREYIQETLPAFENEIFKQSIDSTDLDIPERFQGEIFIEKKAKST